MAQLEGEFCHVTADGWTLIAAWDRSEDKRGGCTASFALQGEHEPEAAVDLARAQFPTVFARIEAHIGRPLTVRAAVLPVVGRRGQLLRP